MHVRHRSLVPIIIVSFAGLAGSAWAQEAGQAQPGPARYIVPTGPQIVTALGQPVVMQTQRLWKPVCGVGASSLTAGDLRQIDTSHAAAMADVNTLNVVDRQQGVTPRAGLNLVYTLGGSVPPAAVSAFAAAEAYLEGQFPNDPITVSVSVSFAALSPGVIGGTGSSYGYVDWATSRSVLVSSMDASDTIHTSLPSASLPVRYNTSSTTAENRLFWTFANWKAAGGTVSGADANMQYSTAFPFDFDPSNGVTSGTMSLQDVVIHETGHAMGFTSAVDFRSRDAEVLDVFRFRNTDGTGASDLNPDSAAEFTARPRWLVRNNPNNDVNFDNIAAEYPFSDGSPYQASHFRQLIPAIGIMDPAFDYGETFYPTFLRTTDVNAFDAIGWDR